MVQGVGKKLHTPLLFSAYLDMRPFLSSTVLQERFAAKHTSWDSPKGSRTGADAEGGSRPTDDSSLYELYAVVCHRGHLQVCAPVTSQLHDPLLPLHDPFSQAIPIFHCMLCRAACQPPRPLAGPCA
jgi:hypothetical protein